MNQSVDSEMKQQWTTERKKYKAKRYCQEATAMRCHRMGIHQSWQQGQERLHRELKRLRESKVGRTPVHFLQEWKTAICQQEKEEMLAIRGLGELRLVPHLKHLELEETKWEMMTSDVRRQHLMKIIDTPKKESSVNLTKGIPNNRKGRKPNVPLKRDDRTAAPNYTLKSVTPKLSENYEPFLLDFAPRQPRICGGCKCNILFTLSPPDNIVFKHRERYVFPITHQSDGKSWDKTGVSSKMRETVYHYNPGCIYGHFRSVYFDVAPLTVAEQVQPYLHLVTGFSHPTLN